MHLQGALRSSRIALLHHLQYSSGIALCPRQTAAFWLSKNQASTSKFDEVAQTTLIHPWPIVHFTEQIADHKCLMQESPCPPPFTVITKISIFFPEHTWKHAATSVHSYACKYNPTKALYGQTSTEQKTRLIISLLRLRDPLPSKYASVCKTRVLTFQRQYKQSKLDSCQDDNSLTFFSSPKSSDHVAKARKQSQVSSVHIHRVLKPHWHFTCPVSIRAEWGFVVQMPGTALKTFSTSHEGPRVVSTYSHAKTGM